ncbi:hypothetical protein CEP54_010605 [Fusarium duplospermum]|uniref:Uncharacterized protein n=1 Tax=Fusarium duplospermum TaxID=1325734 RepID=A0A428PIZ8_9HYPO|nr:hypothetical protein CEP54_010605 [Fusarium duplospermum]
MPPRRPARREPLEGPVYSSRDTEVKRLRLFARTDEGGKPTQIELDFLPSYSPDDGDLRIKVGRNSDGQRSIGWMRRLDRDDMPPFHRETLSGVVNVFPGGRSILRENCISPNILGALFAIFIIFISNPPSAYIPHFTGARGIGTRDPFHNQDPWNWGLEVKSLLAQPGTNESIGSFHPAYEELFHKYTVSYDPPLVGDLMSAVSQLGYSSRHVLAMPFTSDASRKPFNPDKFFKSLVHGLEMIRPHRPELARISHETAKYYPSFIGMHIPIQKFPDELDKYLITLTRDLNTLSEALELPNEISMLLSLDKLRENKLTLQDILSGGAEDPTEALKYLEDLRAMSTVKLLLFHLEEDYRGLRLERLFLKYNSLRVQSMQM